MFPFKDNRMKELGSQVAGGGKDSQQTQPKTKHPTVRTGRPVLSEQQSGSSVQEIENVSNVTAKAPMKEHGDLFSQLGPKNFALLFPSPATMFFFFSPLVRSFSWNFLGVFKASGPCPRALTCTFQCPGQSLRRGPSKGASRGCFEEDALKGRL